MSTPAQMVGAAYTVTLVPGLEGASWPDRDPLDVLPYAVDCTAFLAEQGFTLTATSFAGLGIVAGASGTLSANSVNTGGWVQLSGGTPGQTATVTATLSVTDSVGNSDTLILPISIFTSCAATATQNMPTTVSAETTASAAPAYTVTVMPPFGLFKGCRWPIKSPAAVLTYAVDATAWLASNFMTITGSEWFIDSSLSILATALVGSAPITGTWGQIGEGAAGSIGSVAVALVMNDATGLTSKKIVNVSLPIGPQ